MTAPKENANAFQNRLNGTPDRPAKKKKKKKGSPSSSTRTAKGMLPAIRQRAQDNGICYEHPAALVLLPSEIYTCTILRS